LSLLGRVEDDRQVVLLPVIVGSVKGRGVVSAASYEARKFGVHSAMPISTARRLCPQGIFVPVRMQHYAEISRQIREIFHSFTPLVEPLSLRDGSVTFRITSEWLNVTGAAVGRRDWPTA
jgi:nucleotidyltransferase/DNA polymerase involved in DNA repair